jgi:hypothetical protein
MSERETGTDQVGETKNWTENEDEPTVDKEGQSWRVSRPGNVLAAASLGYAVVATGLAGPSSALALVATGVGVLGLTVGLSTDDRRVAGLGTLALLGGVLAAGAGGVSAQRLLPATAAGLLASEFGLGSFDLRTELRGGTVERSELRHVVAASLAGALVTGVVYAVSEGLRVGTSVPALTLLLVAAVALGLALRD